MLPETPSGHLCLSGSRRGGQRAAPVHLVAKILPLNTVRAHVNAMISLRLLLQWISAVDLQRESLSDLNWEIYLKSKGFLFSLYLILDGSFF